MKIIYKNIWHLLGKAYWLVLFILAGISVLAILSEFGIPKQNQIFVVQSGSMAPAIKTGSLVMVQPNNNYSKGDVITFKKVVLVDANTRQIQAVTHRVWDVKNVKGVDTFITKGDANKSPDMEVVNRDNVIGKVTLAIPYVGFPVGFAKTQNGFVLIVLIPAAILIYSEIMNIKNEAVKLFSRRSRKGLERNLGYENTQI